MHGKSVPVSIDVRDEFRSGGWSLLPEYFLHCLPESQVVLPPAPYAYACVNKTEVSKVSPDS